MIYAILLSILVGLALSYSQLQEIYNFLRAKSTLDSSGQVKVNGVVKANVITSPLSQSPCALWKPPKRPVPIFFASVTPTAAP